MSVGVGLETPPDLFSRRRSFLFQFMPKPQQSDQTWHPTQGDFVKSATML